MEPTDGFHFPPKPVFGLEELAPCHRQADGFQFRLKPVSGIMVLDRPDSLPQHFVGKVP